MSVDSLLSTLGLQKLKIRGVGVIIKGGRVGASREEWRDILETWLNVFDSVGWLDDFEQIKIGDDIVGGTAIGRYTLNNSINLEKDVDLLDKSHLVVENSPRATLIHEMLHYVHVELCGGIEKELPVGERVDVCSEVSYYAIENSLEAVAEIGTGIILGYEFPDKIHDIYEKYGGPMEVYEIGEAIR